MQGVQPDIVLLQEFSYGSNTTSDIETFVEVTFGTGFSYYRDRSSFISGSTTAGIPRRFGAMCGATSGGGGRLVR